MLSYEPPNNEVVASGEPIRSDLALGASFVQEEGKALQDEIFDMTSLSRLRHLNTLWTVLFRYQCAETSRSQ